MSSPVTLAQLQERLDSWEFTRRYGFRADSAGDGIVRLEVPYLEAHDRPNGRVSGMVYMHAADVGFWLAVTTRLGLDAVTVTTQLNTSFLAPAQKERFWCRAEVLKVGRTLCYGTATCVNDAGRILSHHTLEYIRIE